MVVTNDRTLYQRICLFRSHGITRDADRMEHNEGGWFYEQQALGFNYRITDIQCALGVSQMKKLDTFLAERHRSIQRLFRRHPAVSDAGKRQRLASVYHSGKTPGQKRSI